MLTNSLTLARFCSIIRRSADGKKAICIDKENERSILDFINQSPRYLKKWRFITSLVLEGHRNTELYDKEDINGKAKDVTAMKFFKGQENARLYCKEKSTKDGLFIVVAVEVHERKKSTAVSKKEVTIIEKIAKYDYQIE